MKGEPSSGGNFDCLTEEKVIVGSLRTTSEDRWACKVPLCTGEFHRLKDCRPGFPQNGPGRQVQAGRPSQPLPGLSDPRPWPSRLVLPL
jgi:hypothetical protein